MKSPEAKKLAALQFLRRSAEGQATRAAINGRHNRAEDWRDIARRLQDQIDKLSATERR